MLQTKTERRAKCIAVAILVAAVWTLWPPPACLRGSLKYSMPHRRLTVYAIYKNEGEVLEEWLDHYWREGADSFILVDNGSTDNATVPARYRAIVKRFYDPRPRVQHEWLQNDLAGLHTVGTAWLLPLDLDEFAFATDPDQRLVDVLDDQSCFTSRIQMESHRFGDSGQAYGFHIGKSKLTKSSNGQRLKSTAYKSLHAETPRRLTSDAEGRISVLAVVDMTTRRLAIATPPHA